MVIWLVLIYFVDGTVRFAGILKDIGERKRQMLITKIIANCKISTREALRSHVSILF